MLHVKHREFLSTHEGASFSFTVSAVRVYVQGVTIRDPAENFGFSEGSANRDMSSIHVTVGSAGKLISLAI